MAQLGGQPVIILKEGTTRTKGRAAQKNNIAAAKIIAEIVKTTLGPKGMDKILVDSIGDVIVTNDGATILEKMDVEHPAAKMIVEVAKTQDNTVGDGTTTAVVLAGELLKHAEELVEQKIHPSTVISGYKKALDIALEELRKLGRPVKLEDRPTLKKIVMTALASKSLGFATDHIADLAIDAVLKVIEERDSKLVADKDSIQIIKKMGKSLLESQLVHGVIVDKEVVHPAMPKRVVNAKIALISAPFEIEKTEFSAEIRIRDPLKIKEFLDEETRILKEMVDKVAAVGANVVFCQKGIDDMAQFFLAKAGILAVRRVKASDMEKLAKATGGRIVTNFEDLTEKDLGRAGLVEEVKIGEDRMVFVQECQNPKAVSILIRAGLERQLDEAERALNDAIMNMITLIDNLNYVPGGGAIEEALALRVRKEAAKYPGREQLAMMAFAEALETIPRTLAENAGLEPVEILTELRSKQDKDGYGYGVDVFSGKVTDMFALGVIEPVKVKEQALKSSFEAAAMILRIDDVIAASRKKEEKGKEKPSETEFE
ncbi:MAG: TCP-1/cpn60 chaperonin family protein [Thaumarchaeota archaeon]|jgi:thermosome|nr:TCP-1/cpn60 chaperonin family protein [Candidatus Geocrenenecus arthurdayi]MCL7388405.1 TCP-1/cpn60 chaperonin family protein [Candidatus Geocrenenecus arthurdayi]MCL7390733.1 TCP-1/cpn60 chaperonin family protein [Candidatus Geocrenenecus arthurdayi]MCL7402071.1 TCP-1/cpn60 chaperonin family protein [Candidatus Geocrenenecus arthurdayi]MCL7404094.1 TCP-1/cpn60 chaperonin family protein [Candidatus Geocrenenecus arthurdayi]